MIITGHSVQMTRADLAQMADFVQAFVDAARAGKAAGRSAAEVAAAWEAPAGFDGFNSPPAERLTPYVQVIFDELE